MRSLQKERFIDLHGTKHSDETGIENMTNVEICSELSKLVLTDLYQVDADKLQYCISPCLINDFSITFSIFLDKEPYKRGIFIKIPKADEIKQNIYPINSDDRNIAEEEYRSLISLSKRWNSGETTVSFVTPISYQKKYNAIILEHLYASDAFNYLRAKDLARKFKRGVKEDRATDLLSRLGAALAKFHELEGDEQEFSMDRVLKKITQYCADLEAYGVSQECLRPFNETLAKLVPYRAQSKWSDTLKGLDVRNILMDQSGRFYLIDPGKMKKDFRETDLARFIVTLRILYWGSMWFFLGITPEKIYETSFLNGYYGRKHRCNKILSLLIIQEYLKHWRRAHKAIILKRWPALIKSFLRSAYINAFYKKQVAAELLQLYG